MNILFLNKPVTRFSYVFILLCFFIASPGQFPAMGTLSAQTITVGAAHDLVGNLPANLPFTAGETSTSNKYASAFTNCAVQTEIPTAECNALLTLYNNTNGLNWIDKTGWLQTDTPCSWFGIICDSESRVKELHLPSNNLVGWIPPDLGNLTKLTCLDFSGNDLTGAIPVELGNLTNLTDLHLGFNQLTGAIPYQLGNLPNLGILFLSGNRLTGSIPSQLGNLSNLTYLYLDNNQLTGSIPPQLGNLASLTVLWLNSNQLTGSIPTELGDLAKLEMLWLNNNRLTGSIPTQLGNLTKLSWLYLQANRLTGEFPTSIVNLTNLSYFAFDCWITSTDPAVIAYIEALIPGWQNNICPIVLSVTRASPNPTSAASVDYIVTFSEPVSGVDANDFDIHTTSNITGASIINVSGGGTAYIINVSTGTHNVSSVGSININTGTLAELDSLPGIGPTTAQRIIDYRTLNGPFFRIEDIMNVSGIGPGTFENIKELITVGGPFFRLDIADNDTIANSNHIQLGGPGMGNGNYTSGQIYTMLIQTFADVPLDYWANSYIERLYNARITSGCENNPLQYCPEASVTRAQMAVFLEKGVHYPNGFTPPNVVPSFNDIASHWAEDWIEALRSDGITGGCGTNIYCPEDPVTRAQMAVFLLKSKYGSSFFPPDVGASTGFNDVPADYWAAAWIKQLAADGITSGCETNLYCPESPVTRAQMAVFLVRTFNLP